MSKKFRYGYDVNAYIDKAFERMKETYFWATKEMLNPEWTYAIEQDEDGEYQLCEQGRPRKCHWPQRVPGFLIT